ncbi:MAG: hypothetical protein ACREH9_04830, partial [Pseudomonadota bacterium]
RLPGPNRRPGVAADDPATAPSAARPSTSFLRYWNGSFGLAYPDNWQALAEPRSNSVTIASRGALRQGANGAIEVGYGAMAGYYAAPGGARDLWRDTNGLIRQLREANSSTHAGIQHDIRVAGEAALSTSLTSASPYWGETEVDELVSVERPQGLFYIIFIAPRSEWTAVQPAFENMLQSVQF